MKKKVLIVEKCHDILFDQLNKIGYDCEKKQKITQTELLEIIDQYYGLVVRSKIKVDKTLIDQAKRLHFVARVGSGMELIDTAYAKSKKIECINSPEGNRDSVAEHVVGCIISLLKNIHKSNRELKKGDWVREDNRGSELGSKTVGIIGFGNTGSALSEKLSGFNCKILAYDKYKSNFGDEFVLESKMSDIFAEADIVSIHLPLNEETNQIINSEFLNNFHKNIYFVNSSRGPIVNTLQFLDLMRAGNIVGAALDVFEYEPFFEEKSEQERELLEYYNQYDNLILTPHTAGLTTESYYKLAEILSQKIKKNKNLSI